MCSDLSQVDCNSFGKILPSVKEMLEGNANRYPLVVAVAKRAREIVSEHELRAEEIPEDPVILAIKDFENGFSQIDYSNSKKILQSNENN